MFPQAGVSATAWVFGHQIFDIAAMLLHPALFYAWMYVLTLSPVPAWSYYIVLLVVGWYTTGLGYLVSIFLTICSKINLSHPKGSCIVIVSDHLVLPDYCYSATCSAWMRYTVIKSAAYFKPKPKP